MTRRRPVRHPALGATLRRARLAVRPPLSGSALARKLAWNQAKVSLLESGRQTPSGDDVAAWAAATGADVTALHAAREQALTRHLDIRAAARRPGGTEALQGDLEALESASSIVAEYQPAVVPGLAQTAAYTRTWIGQPGRVELGGPIDPGVIAACRGARQRRLRGRAITVAMPPAVLTAAYGDGAAGRAVQREQLDAIEAAAADGIELIVATRPIALLHGFELLDDAVIVETALGGHVLADPDVVAAFRRALAWLRSHGAVGAQALREVHAARAALTDP